MGRGTILLLLLVVDCMFYEAALAVEAGRSGFTLPGVPDNVVDDGTRLCRTVRICHSSKTFALSTKKVLDALEGLALQLNLRPIRDFVQIIQQKEVNQEGCIKEGCCCSSPIEVQISIPRDPAGGEAADLLNLAILAEYVEHRLPTAPSGVTCMGQLQECKQLISEERRKLLSAAPEVTYETAVIPVPDMPTGIAPGTTAVPESAAVKAATSSSSTTSQYSGSYGDISAGYGSYGSYIPVAAADDASAERGPARRSLMAQAGHTQFMSVRPTSCPPCPTCEAGASSSSSALHQQLPGSCYCRYDSMTSTWALEEAACRSALYSRCGPAGSLLECAHLEGFYSAMSHPGVELPHRDLISAFLFVDCLPAPPCSCAAAVAAHGGESRQQRTVAGHSQCCADLRVHCQVPFSGLDCADVSRFCGSTRNNADNFGAVYSYVVVKTHNVQCKDPQFTAAYTTSLSGSFWMADHGVAAVLAIADDVEAEALPLLLLRDELSRSTFPTTHRHALTAAVTIILTLMGSCLVAAVMLAGIISIVQQYGIKQCISPLPADWTAY